jgi:hypothetical protein
MSVTLQEIESKQNKLEKMIAEFKAQTTTIFKIQEKEIPLSRGEHCAGMIIGKEGELSYYLILMAGELEKTNWEDAKKWAEKQGGDLPSSLPSRREQALLYANLKEEFQKDWYWSNEQHASKSSNAWYQGFEAGDQTYTTKYCKLRARAVRRLVI